MSKSRQGVRQIGFWDPELSDPALGPTHDEICKWVYESPVDLARRAFPSVLDGISQVKILERTWERPLLFSDRDGRHQRIVGYADLYIRLGIRIEKPLAVDDLTTPGASESWDDTHRAGKFIVEVKSAIPVLGDLLRQLQLYKLVAGTIVVVSPDDAHAETIREQGFCFVKYE